MDPRHRDKVAFVRVCSGTFQKGMKVQVARSNKTVALTRPQKMFAQDRETVETGYAGDGQLPPHNLLSSFLQCCLSAILCSFISAFFGF